MRSLLALGLCAVLVVSVVVVGFLFGGSDKDAERDAALIRQLGNSRYSQRVEASKQLKERGEAALSALRGAAANHPDLEIRHRAHQLVRTIVSAAGKSKSTGLEMVIISDGELRMGSPFGEPNRRADELQHAVRITKTFLLGKHEVTQEQYRQVMKASPSSFCETGKDKSKVRGINTNQFPVDSVTWFDAIEFCNRLSKLDGHKPYYKLTNVKRGANGITGATVTIVGGNGYRLPTEAEWEHACRGWTTTPFHFGKTNTGREANVKATISAGVYGGSSSWRDLKRTAAVGSYPPNGWGLHDVHGNVAEWCWDWYGKDYYGKGPIDDPHGPDDGTHRAARGGSWLVNERSCRSAARLMLAPDQATYYAGFRVARTP